MTALREFNLDASIIRDLYQAQSSPSGRHRCPACSDQRKREHRFEKTLAITARDGLILFDCKHCPLQGAIKETASWVSPSSFKARKMPADALQEIDAPSVAALPIEPSGAISEAVRDWFKGRGISELTLKKAGVYTAPYRSLGEGIHFPYFEKGHAYAVKVRSHVEKKFSQIGSAATYWNAHNVKPGEPLYIVEGECDALAIMEAGFNSVVSVPCGAPVRVSEGKIDPREDKKFAFCWTGRELYDQASKIVIACDMDGPGMALAEEIARRVGKARCWKVDWPEGCKDANDVLIKHGAGALQTLLLAPFPWPISGVYDANHFADETRALFHNGTGKGTSTGFSNVDDIFTIQPGHLTLVTGVPGSGKTSWVNAVLINLARDHHWNFAIHSAETSPDIHLGQLAALYLEKSFFQFGNAPRMTEAELDQGIQFVNDHAVFLHSENNPTYEDVIERLKVAVLRSGIRVAVVDPVGYLNRGGEGNDVEWAGQMLEAFKSFATSHDVAIFCIAHPHKLQTLADGSQPVPKGGQVSGSAHYYNRPDAGLTIHRSTEDRSISQVHCWKARFGWIAKEGMVELYYDQPTGRFDENPFPSNLTPIYSALSPNKSNDPWDGL